MQINKQLVKEVASATNEEIGLGFFHGFQLGRGHGTAEAHAEPRFIVLEPNFFELPTESKYHVVIHEIGHYWASDFIDYLLKNKKEEFLKVMSGDLDSPLVLQKVGIKMQWIYGQTRNVDEALADAFASYHSSAGTKNFLRDTYPKAYTFLLPYFTMDFTCPVEGIFKQNEMKPASTKAHATAKMDTKVRRRPATFEAVYKKAVTKNKGKLMRVKVTDAFLSDLEKLANVEKVEYSGGLDFEQGQAGITGIKKKRGTHWSSPFFKQHDHEAQFHTHVAYRLDYNVASSHPSPADMGNVSLTYPGFILWKNKQGVVQWTLLRSTMTAWASEQAMEALYNKAEKIVGNNTSIKFNNAWRKMLNSDGMDFQRVIPNKTFIYVEKDTMDKPAEKKIRGAG